MSKTSFVSAYSFALVHSGLGELDETFAWFEKAYDERSGSLPFLGMNPRFDALRGDPRFQRLLRRIGLG